MRSHRPKKAFIAQSIRSDYCAVYACSMLLTLLGVDAGKQSCMRSFGIRRNGCHFNGVTYSEISRVLQQSLPFVQFGWKFRSHSSFNGIVGLLQSHFSRIGVPTLVVFGAVHERMGVRCRHAAVAISTGRYGIRLLDSLGRMPKDRVKWNVTILSKGNKQGLHLVKGARYLLDPQSQFGILQWQLKDH